jgi:SAM-dependent methyltransferase
LDEIFERVIPETPLEWTGERLTTATTGQVEVEHLHRYFLARYLCRDLEVLDVASGEGYGSALLAQVARSVIGVEVSTKAVAHAISAYHRANLRFLVGDARWLPLGDASVDAVVSFETIEHFYEHDQFMTEVRRVLRPGGRFIASSPERDTYSPPGSSANPYHLRELSRVEFSDLLRNSFAYVRLLGQRPMLGSALISEERAPVQSLTFEKRGPRHFEAASGLLRPVYFAAVASDHPVADVPDSLYIETADVGTVLAAAGVAEAATAELASLRARVNASENERASRAEELVASDAAARALQIQLADAHERLGASQSQSVESDHKIAALTARINQAAAESADRIADLADSVTDRERQLAALKHLLVRRDWEMAALLASTSWRITKPWRLASAFLRSVRRRGRTGTLNKSELPDGFDGDAYLRLHPDVAASGADPADHYLRFGRGEGRAFFAATREASNRQDQTRLPTDSEDNSDAQVHHEVAATSAVEGQLPNGFDGDLYLKLYPDVAASGVDPASHYLQYGRREGRLCSAPSDADLRQPRSQQNRGADTEP